MNKLKRLQARPQRDVRLAFSELHNEHVILFGHSCVLDNEKPWDTQPIGHKQTLSEKEIDPLQRLINANNLYDLMLSAEHYGQLFPEAVLGNGYGYYQKKEKETIWNNLLTPDPNIPFQIFSQENETRTHRDKTKKTIEAFGYNPSDWYEHALKHTGQADQGYERYNLLSDWVAFILLLRQTILLESFFLGNAKRDDLVMLGLAPDSEFPPTKEDDCKEYRLGANIAFSKDSAYKKYLETFSNVLYSNPFGCKFQFFTIDTAGTFYLGSITDMAYDERGLSEQYKEDWEEAAARNVAETVIDGHIMGCFPTIWDGKLKQKYLCMASEIYLNIAELFTKDHIGICDRPGCLNAYVSNSKKTKHCSNTCKTAKAKIPKANPTE